MNRKELDPPTLIGLVGNGLGGWALWNRQDNAMEAAVQYIRADIHIARIEADGKLIAELREALEEIARQKRTDELVTSVDVEYADFEQGYDDCIDCARAILAKLEKLK